MDQKYKNINNSRDFKMPQISDQRSQKLLKAFVKASYAIIHYFSINFSQLLSGYQSCQTMTDNIMENRTKNTIFRSKYKHDYQKILIRIDLKKNR